MVTSEPEPRIARLVRVHGRVQGVWYRGWTAEQAQLRSVAGWVRNRVDGSVEALFVGEQGVVAEMLSLCRQGPPSARVTRIEDNPYEDDSMSGLGDRTFEIRPTA